MVEMNVARWHRYGQDRLYIQTADGTRVGWYDLATDVGHVDEPCLSAEFDRAVADWIAEHQPTVATPTAEPAPDCKLHAQPIDAGYVADGEPPPPAEGDATPASPAPAPGEEDLASRRPGAMARQQADALYQAAPVRSFVARLLRIHTDERAWRKGAAGEQKVAAQLAKLARRDPRWRALHAVPVGANGSDIDHVVVGPGGVYTLNAKHHPGAKIWVGANTFLVNGQRQPYLRNSRHEAARAARLLTAACGFPVTVTGVIVPVNADDLVVRTAPEDVHVVNRMRLASWLGSLAEVLDETSTTAIFDAARRPATWTG